VDLAQAAEESGIPEGNSTDKEHFLFHVEFEGKSGTVTNKILTGDEKEQASVIAARYRSGMSIESIEPLRAHIQRIKGWLMISLTDKPKWLDLGKIADDDFVLAVWEVVQQHEAEFRRSRPSSKVGD
jgi:hypothetical protein